MDIAEVFADLRPLAMRRKGNKQEEKYKEGVAKKLYAKFNQNWMNYSASKERNMQLMMALIWPSKSYYAAIFAPNWVNG